MSFSVLPYLRLSLIRMEHVGSLVMLLPGALSSFTRLPHSGCLFVTTHAGSTLNAARTELR